QVVGRQLRQDLGIDIIVAERGHKPLKAQTLQPRRYVHAVILGFEGRSPSWTNLDQRQCRMSRLQPVNDRFDSMAPQTGANRDAGIHPAEPSGVGARSDRVGATPANWRSRSYRPIRADSG